MNTVVVRGVRHNAFTIVAVLNRCHSFWLSKIFLRALRTKHQKIFCSVEIQTQAAGLEALMLPFPIPTWLYHNFYKIIKYQSTLEIFHIRRRCPTITAQNYVCLNVAQIFTSLFVFPRPESSRGARPRLGEIFHISSVDNNWPQYRNEFWELWPTGVGFGEQNQSKIFVIKF